MYKPIWEIVTHVYWPGPALRLFSGCSERAEVGRSCHRPGDRHRASPGATPAAADSGERGRGASATAHEPVSTPPGGSWRRVSTAARRAPADVARVPAAARRRAAAMNTPIDFGELERRGVLAQTTGDWYFGCSRRRYRRMSGSRRGRAGAPGWALASCRP